MKKKILITSLLMLLVMAPASAMAKQKVYGATFPASFALYVLDPELLAGWNGPLRDYEKKFIPEKYHHLPILGGWYGKGMIPDKEVLLRAKFDKAFTLTGDHKQGNDALSVLKKLGIPTVALPARTLQENIVMFRAMGIEFEVPERGEALAAYGENALARVAGWMKDLPESKRVRIYMAQDVDGLTTTCAGGIRSEVFDLAGAVNVHACPENMRETIIKISFEQILRYDPDVILINHPTFMDRFPRDTRWHQLRAAKTGNVFFVPHEPFSWMDRPASFMRFIGAQWLAETLHPDRCEMDMEAETDKFLRLFFRLELSPEEIRSILKKDQETGN